MIPIIHPAAIVRGGWQWREATARDLAKALQESKSETLSVPPRRYCAGWQPALDPPIPATIPLTIDLETVRGTNKITQFNASWERQQAIAGRANEATTAAFKAAIEQAGRTLTFHHAQFDVPVLEDNGILQLGGWVLRDTLVGAALLDPDLPNTLESVARDAAGFEPWKYLAETDLLTYGCIDADATWQTDAWQRTEIERLGLSRIYDTAMKILPLLMEMKRTGLRIGIQLANDKTEECKQKEQAAIEELDALVATLKPRRERAEQLETEIAGLLSEAAFLRENSKKGPARALESRAKQLGKEAIKLLHPKWLGKDQLLQVLDDLGLPRKANKDGKVTTDAAAIQELARQTSNPVLMRLLELRGARKLRSTYFAKAAKIAGADGKIHPEYLLSRSWDDSNDESEGAASGRLASKGPNIQNWPAEARGLVIPDDPEHELMEADYKQIEFYLYAYRTGGRLWRDVNTVGFDVHRTVASEVYGVPFAAVTKFQRDIGKRAVYAALYKVGPLTLSRAFAKKGIFVSVAECKKLLGAFYKLYGEVKETQRQFVAEAFATCKVTNPFGRYRKFFKPDAEVTKICNHYAQSSAGDIILRAMAVLRQQLPREARIAIQVHDSLVLSYPKPLRAMIQECLLDVMTRQHPEMPNFRPAVDLKIGPSWGEMVPLIGTQAS